MSEGPSARPRVKHRIRAAALITCGESILLVKHEDPPGREWWVPPGGGIEGCETAAECATRETLEETGLEITVGRLVYVREFLETRREVRHAELFFEGIEPRGTLLTGSTVEGDSDPMVKGADFVPRESLPGLTVWPEVLYDAFWDDLSSGFPSVKYLGLSED